MKFLTYISYAFMEFILRETRWVKMVFTKKTQSERGYLAVINIINALITLMQMTTLT